MKKQSLPPRSLYRKAPAISPDSGRALPVRPVNAGPEPVNAKAKDWHKPGYMAEYMRGWRQRQKDRARARVLAGETV